MASSIISIDITGLPDIYTLSLHDALPISFQTKRSRATSSSPTGDKVSHRIRFEDASACGVSTCRSILDRKSTRLNSSHRCISYAVFCLKKKKQLIQI